jgi:hypothetical protein
MDNHSRERRRFGRRSVFKVATVVQGAGDRLFGHVIDISEGGARIQLPEVSLLMPEFFLEIPEDDFVVRCRLVHTLQNSAGVEFTRPPRRLSWVRQSNSAR